MRVRFLWIKPNTGKDSSRRALKSAMVAAFKGMPYFLHRKFTSGCFR